MSVSDSAENIVEKGKIARNDRFPPFLENFLPFLSNLKLPSAHFQFRSLTSVIWGRHKDAQPIVTKVKKL